MPRPIIAYYRVSTAKQGRSGLGLCVGDHGNGASASVSRASFARRHALSASAAPTPMLNVMTRAARIGPAISGGLSRVAMSATAKNAPIRYSLSLAGTEINAAIVLSFLPAITALV